MGRASHAAEHIEIKRHAGLRPPVIEKPRPEETESACDLAEGCVRWLSADLGSSLPEQAELLLVEPSLASYVTGLTEHAHGRGVRALQRLLRFVREYPRQPLLDAVRDAE